MSNISKLIEELCPDGVEYEPLENFLDYAQPSKYIVSHTNYSNDFKTPVLTPGKTFILGYTDDIDGIFDASDECPVILFDDFTTSFRWIDFKFKVKSSAVKILSSKDSGVSFKYIYYAMKTIRYETLDHSRQWISNYSKITIPVPPLVIQEEIVRILDGFTLLEAELEAELEARRKQYAFYRDSLLSFENVRGGVADVWTLQDVLKIKNGRDYKHLSAGEIPVYGSGGVMLHVSESIYEKASVLIPRKGSLGNLFYVDNPFWVVDTIFYTLINIEKILPKYLYHYLLTADLASLNTAGGVPSLTQTVLNKVKIPVPPIEEQQRIVDILDRFDALVNDISSGLPAEIAARRKQYEHYRDQLLTFKELQPAGS